MDKVFAVTTRGLEGISSEEMASLPGVRIESTGYRRVSAVCEGDLSVLLNLRTVDDIFLDLGSSGEMVRQRSALASLRAAALSLPLAEGAANLSRFRTISNRPTFSVTANFVGKRNYATDEIKTALAQAAASRMGWRYVEDDAKSELNLRAFIEHGMCYFGLRLGERSLHRRPYKIFHTEGSLKPPVAAAMLRLSKAGEALIDPTCGSGTILIEAALAGIRAAGGDIDQEALRAAAGNAKAAGLRIPLSHWDARRLPLSSGSVRRIAANLPWGRQVEVSEALAGFYNSACQEMCRVLQPQGRVVLLTSLPDLVHLAGLQLEARLEISLFGQNPHILVYQAS
jgi:23S rRNA G2445 N2-methylase RlmL